MTTSRRLCRGARVAAIGAAVALALGACAGNRPTADSAASSYLFQVREYLFPSGLRVVIEQDDTTPITGVVLVVEAGSIDDPPGKNGLAHTFEHLFFRAPADAGMPLWKALSRISGTGFNGWTGPEQTTYEAFAPRSSLDDLVGALLARMADPTRGVDDAALSKEMRIVAEELRTRRDKGASHEALAAVLPPTNPTARAFAGRHQAGVLTLADIDAFAARGYGPERMTLVISGAIGADWDNRLGALLPPKLRGQAARRQPPVRRSVVAAAAAPTPDNRIQIVKGSVSGPELWMAWPLPAETGLESLAFTVMANVADRIATDSLDGSASVVLDLDTSVLTGSQASAFICRAHLRSAADADRARTEVGTIIEGLAGVPLPIGREFSTRYRHAVRETALHIALGIQYLPTRAHMRADIVHRGAATQLSEILAALQKISVDDLATLADRYLQRGAARSALLLPDDPSGGAAAASKGHLRSASLSADIGGGTEPDREDDDDDLLEGVPLAAPAWAARTRRPRVTTLANGLTVIAMRRPGLPFVTMVLGFHGEPQPGEVPGIRAALPNTVLWSLRIAAIDRGVYHTTQLEPDSYQEHLSLFSANTRSALIMLAEQPGQMRVQWPSPQFTRWVEREGQTDALPAERFRREFRAALFGEHVYRQAPAIDAVRTVTGTQLQGWLEHTRRPNNGALVIVGDIDVDDVTRRAEDLLGGWKGDATPVPAPPSPPPVARVAQRLSPQVLFTHDARRRSTEVRFGCLLPPINTFPASVRSQVLAGLFREELLRGLRFKLGASYSPNVWAYPLRGGTAVLDGSLDVADSALPEALDRLRAWLDPARPIPLKAAAVERERQKMARRNAFEDSINGRVAVDLFHAWNMGWPVAALDDVPKVLAQMSADDIAADLQACRTSAVISVLGNAPPPAAASAPPPK